LNFDGGADIPEKIDFSNWLRIGRRMSALRYESLSQTYFYNVSYTTHLASEHLSDASMSLPKLISTSQTTKARLLHYFPPTPGVALPADDEPVDSWCGFHLDHSLLTGLCSVGTPG